MIGLNVILAFLLCEKWLKIICCSQFSIKSLNNLGRVLHLLDGLYPFFRWESNIIWYISTIGAPLISGGLRRWLKWPIGSVSTNKRSIVKTNPFIFLFLKFFFLVSKQKIIIMFTYMLQMLGTVNLHMNHTIIHWSSPHFVRFKMELA